MRAEKRARRPIALAAAAVLLAAWTSARADEIYLYDEEPNDNGLAIVADLLIARPLGLVTTVVGAAIFTIGLPIELMVGDVETPARKLIVEPAWYTFKRPLGDLSPEIPDTSAE